MRENVALKALAKQLAECLAIQQGRDDIVDPREPEVAKLCERIGYGAVMDCAARLWNRKAPGGAFALAACRSEVDAVLAAARKAGIL